MIWRRAGDNCARGEGLRGGDVIASSPPETPLLLPTAATAMLKNDDAGFCQRRRRRADLAGGNGARPWLDLRCAPPGFERTGSPGRPNPVEFPVPARISRRCPARAVERTRWRPQGVRTRGAQIGRGVPRRHPPNSPVVIVIAPSISSVQPAQGRRRRDWRYFGRRPIPPTPKPTRTTMSANAAAAVVAVAEGNFL